MQVFALISMQSNQKEFQTSKASPLLGYLSCSTQAALTEVVNHLLPTYLSFHQEGEGNVQGRTSVKSHQAGVERREER